MQIKPNSTRLRAEILALRPLVDDAGSEIDVRVLENRSDTDEDFVRPAPGHSLTLYHRKPLPALAPGDIVEVEAELRAGPFGQRVVCRGLEKVADR